MSTETGTEWQQVNLCCDTWQAAEQAAVTHLGPWLAESENSEAVDCWWFLRKGPEWRIRLLPSRGQEETVVALVDQLVAALTDVEALRRWSKVIYEPEIHAFGGQAAMDVAHRLFHADSRHILAHLAHARTDHRRELGLLLGSRLMRGAGQDWYEQGDIWARVAEHRAGGHPAQPPPDTIEAARQLLTAAADAANSPLRTAPAWPAAFDRAGRDLADLAQQGRITRGLRAVLTHHILFALNRLGIPTSQQHLLASASAVAAFDHKTATSGGTRRVTYDQPAASPATVDAVTNDTTDETTKAQEPKHLRAALADRIRDHGTFRTPEVEAAFRAVPRHLFLPDIDLATAYAPQVVVTKRATDGTALSSASSPHLVATMLEQLDVERGHRVLEIGTATGINAALLAELAGPTATVVTIEIDDDLAASARSALATAGYKQVEVISGDGAHGHPDGAPYDRIIVTAGAFDLPAAWWQQLAIGGRLVVPLRLYGGLTRSIGFDHRQPGRMVSTSAQMCGFVPLRGAAEHAERSLHLAEGVDLHVDPSSVGDESALSQALTHPAHQQWTGIHIHDDDPVAHLDLWLATTSGIGFAKLAAAAPARDRGLVDPAWRWGGASLYDEGTLAYLAFRPLSDELAELGVIAHGPNSPKLAAHVSDLLHQWNRTRPAEPIITAHRAGTPPDQLAPGTRVARPETILTVAW